MAIKKPLRIGVLVPQLVLDGDVPHADAAVLVLWSAMVEACSRHSTLSVLDASATPLEPHDGHLAPATAIVGATPNDWFYAPTRRDELIWLSISLPRTVTLHAISRDGSHNKFEGSGRSLGDQIDQAVGAWLAARKLGPLPQKIGAATADELFAATRAIAPALVERATSPSRTVSALPFANRVPAGPFRTAALRTLALAVHADLSDLLSREALDEAPATMPSSRSFGGVLDEVAAAGAAVLAHPRQLVALARYATLLEDVRLGDEGVRLLERVLRHDHPVAHLALLEKLRERDRDGAWFAQAQASARIVGSPTIDLALSEAMIAAGQREQAIALRGAAGDAQELARWRSDSKMVAWADAREAAFRGQPALALAAFARCEPVDAVDVALELDALVSIEREADAPRVWEQHGLGPYHTGAVARLAAARALLSAGAWKRGLAELWRVELGEPGRDEQVAISHCGLLLSCAPLDVLEEVLGEQVAAGAVALARRMARDLADFVPNAASSAVITRALGKQTTIDFDPATLAGFYPDTAGKAGIDATFATLGALRDTTDELARGDRLVNGWLEPVLAASVSPGAGPEAVAQAAAYVAANALGRYLALAAGAATPLAGALRTVAAEAFALLRMHRTALHDRDARAVLAVIEPVLRRVERWVGSTWLGVVERSLGIDERAAGDVAGFAPDLTTINSRLIGPEETAVLAASIARLMRERSTNWASAVAAQATLLALHTGFLGTEAWAEAIVALLAAKEIELDDAVDELSTASYLAEGASPAPALLAARVLLDAGRGPAAVAVLTSAMPSTDDAWRERYLPSLGEAWVKASADADLARASVLPPPPDATVRDESMTSAKADTGWRARRRELEATRERTGYASLVAAPPVALAAAERVLVDSVGLVDRDAMIARVAALRVREQAYFARDPAPSLAPRLPGKLPPVSDRVVVPGSPIARISEYVALLRDLAALPPREALSQFSLDEETYRDVAHAWASALSTDPTLAPAIAAGLAKR